MEFRRMDIRRGIQTIIDDNFIDPKLLELNIDFISYERYYDLHTLTSVQFEFSNYGTIEQSIKSKSLRLNNMQTLQDYATLLATMVYYILYAWITYSFGMVIKKRYKDYLSWQNFEIEYLSEVEIK